MKTRDCATKAKMGVSWSRSSVVSNHTMIVLECDFPYQNPLKEKLWAMHKTYKDALNEDGFTTKKDKYTGWKIVYWHTITNTSHINDEKTGKPFWRVDMDAKLERWMRVLETVELDNPYERRTKTMTSPDTLANLPPPPTTSSKSDSDLDLDLDLDESERPKLPKRRPAAKHKAPQKQKPRPVDVSSLLAAAIEDGDEY